MINYFPPGLLRSLDRLAFLNVTGLVPSGEAPKYFEGRACPSPTGSGAKAMISRECVQLSGSMEMKLHLTFALLGVARELKLPRSGGGVYSSLSLKPLALISQPPPTQF